MLGYPYKDMQVVAELQTDSNVFVYKLDQPVWDNITYKWVFNIQIVQVVNFFCDVHPLPCNGSSWVSCEVIHVYLNGDQL